MPEPPVDTNRRRLTVAVPAKVNPYLRVLGKRADGYHELETLMLAIELRDTLSIELTPDGRGDVGLACSDPALPRDGSNLAWRAAELMREATGRDDSIAISLDKRIPSGAGLGGGSADAAGVIWALDRLWATGFTRERLGELGAQLGSDVPFFFFGPAAVCTGRGEIVTPLAACSGTPHDIGRVGVVLLIPGFPCATPDVYGALNAPALESADRGHANPGNASEPARACVRALATLADSAGADKMNAPAALRNDLEPAARRAVPALDALYRSLDNVPGEGHVLTGSGSTVAWYGRIDALVNTQRTLSLSRLGRVVATHTLGAADAVFKWQRQR